MKDSDSTFIELPDGWQMLSIGECLEFKNGLNKEKSFFGKGTPIVNYMDVYKHRGITNQDVAGKVTVSNDEISNFGIKKGDVFFTRTSETVEEIGVASVLLEDVPNGVFSGFLLRGRPKNDLLDDKFKKYCFHSSFVRKEITSKSSYTTRALTNGKLLSTVNFPCPKEKEEQKAIAEALSDVDALIQSLDKLIAKKKAIKQGTMQRLLKSPAEGGQRLPGFSGEWEVKRLPEVCWFQEGPGLRNWQFTDKGMKVINVTNLENGYLNLSKTDRHISEEEFVKMYKHFEIDEKDIVVASSGNSYCKTAVVRKQDLPLMMNTSVIRFKPMKGLDYNFLLIFLKSNLFKDQVDLLITGGAQPNFGPFHLNKILLNLPELEEQKAIAQILSDMDQEIEALEQKREKYQSLKQGMMQELLTGKKRLIGKAYE